MPSSRIRITTVTHHGRSPRTDSPIRAAPISALSAIGSASFPNSVTSPRLRANCPSIRSVMTATVKMANATSRLTVWWPSPANRNTTNTGTSTIRSPVSRFAMLTTGTRGAAGGGVRGCPDTGTAYPVEHPGRRRRRGPSRFGNRYCAPVSAGDDQLTVRRARTTDVPAIKRLVDTYAGRILLEKNLVTLYEAVQETLVAELDGEVIGCGALHVLWSDLGEVRTVAVDPSVKGLGIGHTIVDRLLDVARELQLQRLFVLTFETDFFARHGFAEIEGTPVTAE